MLHTVGEEVGIDQNGVWRSQSRVVLEEKRRGNLRTGITGLLAYFIPHLGRLENSHFSDNIVVFFLVFFWLLRVSGEDRLNTSTWRGQKLYSQPTVSQGDSTLDLSELADLLLDAHCVLL